MPIKVRESGQWVEVSGNSDGGFVTGMIMMFSGTTAPSGWVLCDNSAAAQAANAPDLRDKFIVGTGSSYNLNATGGSANAVVVQHSHGITDPQHAHGITEPNGGQGHLHNVAYSNSDSGDGVIEESGTGLSGYEPTEYAVTGITINSQFTGITINDQGQPGTNKNLPPYYALAFIMKT